MMTSLVVGGLAAALLLTGPLLIRYRLNRLAAFSFPDHIMQKVGTAYPHLTAAERQVVIEGLRQFFAVAISARGRRVSMPSQAVDVAWHEFILSTRAYAAFCQAVLGRFLHHTPAEAMASRTMAQDGIRRAWRLACQREGFDPRRPDRLPLLFAIDARLAIQGGFTYALNCRLGAANGAGGDAYCAGHIGCSSDGGAGDGDGDGGDGGGDGGGCGGD